MITLKSLLHLRQKVITFRTLLHLGLLQHLSRSTPAEGSTSYATNCFQVADIHCNTCCQDFKGVDAILNSIDVTR